MMRLIIAGSRTVSPSVELITMHVVLRFSNGSTEPPHRYIAEVICGCASGADRAGEEWARRNAIPVHHEPFTEDDMKLGKYHGPKQRNRRMGDRGDGALIFWDGWSGGSADMCTRMVARDKGANTFVIPTAKRKAAPR